LGLCSNWENACSLQTMLTGATSGDEIWGAAGTHKPTTVTDRSATFQLKNGDGKADLIGLGLGEVYVALRNKCQLEFR
jgi:hypothetical protein